MCLKKSLLYRSLLLAASCLFSACSGMTTSCEPPPPVDQALTKACDALVFAADVGWMAAHAQNAVTNAECRIQYEHLVEALRRD